MYAFVELLEYNILISKMMATDLSGRIMIMVNLTNMDNTDSHIQKILQTSNIMVRYFIKEHKWHRLTKIRYQNAIN